MKKLIITLLVLSLLAVSVLSSCGSSGSSNSGKSSSGGNTSYSTGEAESADYQSMAVKGHTKLFEVALRVYLVVVYPDIPFEISWANDNGEITCEVLLSKPNGKYEMLLFNFKISQGKLEPTGFVDSNDGNIQTVDASQAENIINLIYSAVDD